MGKIKLSANLEVNMNTGQVGIDPGSSATGYPSMAIYRYSFHGGQLVTKLVGKWEEGSNRELDRPMKPIDHVKPESPAQATRLI